MMAALNTRARAWVHDGRYAPSTMPIYICPYSRLSSCGRLCQAQAVPTSTGQYQPVAPQHHADCPGPWQSVWPQGKPRLHRLSPGPSTSRLPKLNVRASSRAARRLRLRIHRPAIARNRPQSHAALSSHCFYSLFPRARLHCTARRTAHVAGRAHGAGGRAGTGCAALLERNLKPAQHFKAHSTHST